MRIAWRLRISETTAARGLCACKRLLLGGLDGDGRGLDRLGLGQAARISGITPAAISLLLVHLKRGERAPVTTARSA